MKINKILMILSLFTIFCISLGVVSAGDNVDISVEDISDDCVRNNVNVQTDNVRVSEDINNLSEEYRTFKELNETISNCTTNEITLEYDYKYDSNNDEDFVSGININKNISINGNGHTIDGFNTARAFNVNANQVSIKNLKFTNCNSIENGGAIYGWGSVVNCSFVNCLSKKYGGAIYGWGSVSGCSFVGCSAYYEGGAIFFHEENAGVVNCSFVNCSGHCGGAIYFEENGSVTYCIFENNVSNGNAIYVDNSWLDVDYNFFGFQNNVTSFPQGLVSGVTLNSWVVLNITNSSNDYFVNFVLNDGSSLNESMMDYNVILTINDTDAKEITIKNNSFNDTYLLNSVYKVNSSNTGKLIASAKFGYIEDSFTTLNDLISSNSPVILNHNYKFYKHWDDDFKEGIIIGDNVIIEGNDITINGSGVSKVFRITGENVTIKGINFINARCDSEGGAIYWSGNNGVVSGCSFTNCYTNNEGGAIYWNSNNSSVVNCSFMKCTAFHQGGAIYGNSCNNCSVSGCSFVNCSSNGFVGAIHLVSGNNCSINYCIFEGNSKNVKDIYVKSGTVNADFNFFGFQNNVTSFPQGLVSGVTLNSWVVLNITNSSSDYFVDFVLNDGSSLSASMMDYNVILTINDAGVKEITIKNNSFNDTYVKGHYLLTSLNTNKVLVNITLGLVDYNIITSDCDYGGTATVVVTVPSDVTGNLTFKVDDGQVFTKIINESSISINITGLSVGVHNINIYYSGDDIYCPFNATATLNVEARQSTIFVSASDVSYGSDVTVNVTLDVINGTGNITYYLNGNEYTTEDISNLTLVINNLSAGTYYLTVEYSGDLNNTKSSAKCNFTVSKNNTYFMNVSAINITVAEDEVINVTVPTDATGNVIINVNGTNYTATVKEGVAKLTIKDLKVGNYTVTAYYNDSNYELNSVNTTFTVKWDSFVTVDKASCKLNNSVDLVAHVVADSGLVTFYVNDGEIGSVKLVDGLAKFTYYANVTGSFTIRAVYSGSDLYNSSENTSTLVVTVPKVATNLSASTLTITAYTSKNLVVTLKDSKGKILTGKKVTITFNGKTYSRTTDSKGQAKLAITSKYVKNYTATIKFAGDSSYLSSSKSVKVVIKQAYVTVTDIIKAAKSLKASSKKNKKLPATIKVGSYKLTHGQLT
ncbi:MAG: Ig-like domain repeat protein [archaeon]|nr:Ig-like domain repeat protein [archaeon]